MAKDKLTPKQQMFCKEYLIDLNATQAAIRAGYSVKMASRIGYQLLDKNGVKAKIQQLMDKRSTRTEITADKVLQEIAHIAFDDIRNYLSFYTDDDGNVRTRIKDSDNVDTRSIAEVSQGKDGQFKFKLYCKDEALNSLGKHLKLFTDKTEHSGNIDIKYGISLPQGVDDD